MGTKLKKWYCTFYNYIAQEEQTVFVASNDWAEARKTAIMLIRLRAGDSYGEDDIEYFGEQSEKEYKTFEDVVKAYKVCNKPVDIPVLKYNSYDEYMNGDD